MKYWKKWSPADSLAWDARRVVHLHRRAGFGATWSEVQRDLKDGADAAIDRLLEGTSRTSGVPNAFSSLAHTIGETAVGSNSPNRLKAWWCYRLLFTPDPLAEKLTLMWHNHFATSNLKVDDLSFMREQNEIFRKYGGGQFGELLRAVVHDPAVLVWLDADSNRKGRANENLGRELMELFTLGIGNYSESDVKEAARALTGWTVRKGAFYDKADVHDDGPKCILGQTGAWRGDDLLRILLDHPATSRRVVWRLCQVFMGDGVVSDAAADELAAGLRENNLDIGWAVETILRSDLFFSDANLSSRVSSPVEYVVGAVRALEVFDPPPSTLLLVEWAAQMGQDLFYPPNVGGWSGGKDWLSGQYVVARANFATALTQGRLSSTGDAPNLDALCERFGCQTDVEPFAHALRRLLLGSDTQPGDTQRLVAAVRDSGCSQSEQLRLVASLVLSLPAAQYA